ncbi:MAG: Bug family tripartite tricarboxylate transporter substrate binding protein [Burkholderiaceae bacterium]
MRYHLPMTGAALSVAFCSMLLSASPHASAQPYPNRPITLVVPFSAGGSLDLLCRLIGLRIQESTGQPVLVDNRPGAGGTIGTTLVAKSKPDGYTLLAQTRIINLTPALGAKVSYDWKNDFQPIILLGAIPQALAVPSTSLARSVQEFVALAKKDPGKTMYGTLGEGSGGHLTGRMFEMVAKIQMTPVPYKGSSQTMTALASGQIDMTIGNLPEVLQYEKMGRVRPLALAAHARSELAPQLPTLAEVGFPGVVSAPWYGILAPAGTPEAVIDKIHKEIAMALKHPEVIAKFNELGIAIQAIGPEPFRRQMQEEFTEYERFGREAGIKLQ